MLRNKLAPLSIAVSTALMVGATPVLAKTDAQFEKDTLLVKYKDNTSAADRANAIKAIRASMTDKNGDGIDDKFRHLLQGKLAKLTLEKGSDVERAAKKLSLHPAIEYAEPNYLLHTVGTPDDASFSSLWGMNNTGQTGGTADADIDAPEAWDISTGSDTVIIGVIDTGVDYTHPDLVNNMWVNPGEIAGNGVDDDGNGVVDDVYGFNAYNDSGDPMDGNGHGTHVAGTIGAEGNNAEGVAGVNWDVSIIGCAFLSPSGSGSTADAIECINYFTDLKVNRGIDVRATNNSWGGGGFSQALKDAIEAGGAEEILFVAAAGNGQPGVDIDQSPSYPAAYDSDAILAVASTDHNDQLSGFSHYGAVAVDVGAPGSDILSTVPGGGYSSFSGTSMASPHVAGAAGLAWAVNPSLTIAEMKALLMNTGDAIAALDGYTVSGKRLNLKTLLDESDPAPGFRFAVTPQRQQVIAGSPASYDFSLGAVGGWSGTADLAVTSVPALPGASLSAATAMDGDSFVLTAATAADTQWGEYVLTVTGTEGNISYSKSVKLDVLPQGLMDYPFTNTDAAPIEDNQTTISSIEVADDITVFGVTANVDISHTWIGDLTVSLVSPNGTEAVMHNRTGGSADDLVATYTLDNFNGELGMGTWSLKVSDGAGGDTGTLNSWGLVITALGDGTGPGPVAPVAGFEYAITDFTVDFANTSSDADGDIVSYAWDFGDGSTSTEMSPSYTYAATGIYSVSLTVTDAENNSDTVAMDVEVTGPSDITASYSRAYKSRRGSAMVDLRWDGASGDTVSIYRDGVMVTETNNDGRHRDRFRTDATSVEYQVCSAGGSVCSVPMTVSFN